ncbi:hypothetical protein RHMOL_Rhmol06G0193800 [Rhododendron molle]|uniref:Uncharacterized protein n=2 Tax=Rhododendron molle TaxID=49168 RepID=A0ACC0NGB6_RHOML|nr:hypothetical protein RHMOL_Rhmol06G0193800 [Rhododendron molle]KAI8551528.1 hypothetical protein RHMOL_Rhmol06G0193800 [Rhododendron molle]
MPRLNRKQKRRREEQKGLMALQAFMNVVIGVCRLYLFITSTFRPRRPELSLNPDFYQTHINNINRLVRGNDVDCDEQVRVNRHTFLRLCWLVRGVGLTDSRNVCLEERVAIFLWVLSHHTKQKRTKYQFYRSTKTISRHFNAVLQAVLRLHQMLLETPDPVPANYHDTRWNWFQANPHIDSKVRHWKSVRARIVDITNLSGYGWDAVNKRIDVEQAVWDAYEKVHPKKAQGLYGKSFRYFEDWQTIFGKDKATGAAAEDLTKWRGRIFPMKVWSHTTPMIFMIPYSITTINISPTLLQLP